jgi:LPS-assembly lipoprotein
MGIDVVNSEYATIAAEQSALERLSQMVADQIVARVAIYARNPADSPVPTAPVAQPATNSGSNGG